MRPSKEYQLWTYSDGGYHFEEFSTEADMAKHIQSGTAYGEWFVTRLQEFRADIRNWYPPKVEGAQ